LKCNSWWHKNGSFEVMPENDIEYVKLQIVSVVFPTDATLPSNSTLHSHTYLPIGFFTLSTLQFWLFFTSQEDMSGNVKYHRKWDRNGVPYWGIVQEVLLHMREPLKKAVLTFIFHHELSAQQPSDFTSLIWNMGLLNKWKDISKKYERALLGLGTLCIWLLMFLCTVCIKSFIYFTWK
jgi:hypothetical protein